MRADVQQEVANLWTQINNNNIMQLSDLAGYRHEFHRLFGFDIKGVNYADDVNIEKNIPSIKAS
jgi:enoyl-[acyl-carrier protein] reductase/trans-2-enoyl-CoA reductase (NAD+)